MRWHPFGFPTSLPGRSGFRLAPMRRAPELGQTANQRVIPATCGKIHSQIVDSEFVFVTDMRLIMRGRWGVL
jgi:hypothetical protein